MSDSKKGSVSPGEKQEPVEEGQVFTADSLMHSIDRTTSKVSKDGTIVNASGHRDQLQRQYGLWSICGLALTINSAWIAFGGSLNISVCTRQCQKSTVAFTC